MTEEQVKARLETIERKIGYCLVSSSDIELTEGELLFLFKAATEGHGQVCDCVICNPEQRWASK